MPCVSRHKCLHLPVLTDTHFSGFQAVELVFLGNCKVLFNFLKYYNKIYINIKWTFFFFEYHF